MRYPAREVDGALFEVVEQVPVALLGEQPAGPDLDAQGFGLLDAGG